MDQDIVRQLASQPPPPHRKFRFMRHAAAHEEIKRLETVLEISHSRPSTNIIDLNHRVSQLTELVAKGVSTLPATPAAPAATSAATPEAFHGAAIIETLDAIKHPSDKVEFYRANKNEIDRAYRDAPPVKATYKTTGVRIVDQMNAFDDPRERVAFYRRNKAAIDATYE